MLKFIFAFIVFIHGLIHLLGFAKEWKLTATTPLTGKTLMPLSENVAKLSGLLWLLSCILFLIVVFGFLFKKEWWVGVAFGAVVLSQILIILYWQDAKAGTIANVIIALVAFVAWADFNFKKQIESEASAILSTPLSYKKEIVAADDLKNLPIAVQKWLASAGVVGKEKVHTVCLKQHGLMRSKADANWMKVEAEQYFNVDEPAFIWKARAQMMPLVTATVRDKYVNGAGNMLVKAFSSVTIADATGDKINQGAMLRFLGEIVWFPSAALSPYIKWTAVDSTTAQAEMTYKSLTVSAVFYFNEKGNFKKMTAERYMDRGKEAATLEKWEIPAHEWKRMNGVVIPVRGDAVWHLKEGDLNYYRWEITEIDYNTPEFYN
jgi:hypothetical protein